MPARLPHCHPPPGALGHLPAGQQSPEAPVCPGALKHMDKWLYALHRHHLLIHDVETTTG